MIWRHHDLGCDLNVTSFTQLFVQTGMMKNCLVNVLSTEMAYIRIRTNYLNIGGPFKCYVGLTVFFTPS